MVALNGGPWFVAGLLMAMEALELDFVLGVKTVWKIMVWLRLLGLPMKFWLSSTILAIAAKASRPVAANDSIDLLQKTRYARIRVEIDYMKPLKLGVERKERCVLATVHL